MEPLLKHIVVVGNSISAWVSSAALIASLAKYGVKISHCVLDDTIKPLGNMSIRPEYRDFLDLIGISEPEFMRSSHATFKLANYFKQWNSNTDEFYHAYGEYGTGMANVQFSQAFARLHQAGLAKSVDTYSLGAQLAKAAKFCHPSSDPNSVLSTLSYGWNVDADAYRESLKHYCISRGVQLIEDALVDIELDPATQAIKTLTLQRKLTLSADLFIDCTEDGLLIQALGSQRQSWQSQLPSCEVATSDLPLPANNRPLTTITANADGWFIDNATKQKLTRQRYFVAKPEQDEFNTAVLKKAVIDQQHYGCLTEPWVANCIAIGSSAVALPNLCVSEIDLSWLGIGQLIEQCPRLPLVPQLTHEYNRLVYQRYHRLKDVTCLYLHVADSHTGQLWQQIYQSDMSEDLTYKRKLYQSRGKLAWFDGDVIPATEQISLLMGLEQAPKQLDLMVQQVPMSQLQNIHQKIEHAIQQATKKAPQHADFVQAFCYR